MSVFADLVERLADLIQPLFHASAAAAGKVMPYLPYLTLVTVAVVPLAAALYVVTSTTWSAVERVVLHR
ncbi:hypothetical protein [Streptomyces sp. NPDC058964]|uniref:hypothetical protein n=1 Tax=Streptomyces sp. NPDC058964 TaxID=3346681 RepID=UPI0036C36F11